jgi:hypothetical protein
MLIAVAGPYSAPTADERARNLGALHRAAAEVFRRGHVPVVGVDAALPVVAMLGDVDARETIMTISLALVGRCDAILVVGASPGADRERDLVAAQGKRVFRSLDEVPDAQRRSL